MSWLILLLSISNLKDYGIQVILKIASATKITPHLGFVNKLNFQVLKKLITKQDISKIKNFATKPFMSYTKKDGTFNQTRSFRRTTNYNNY